MRRHIQSAIGNRFTNEILRRVDKQPDPRDEGGESRTNIARNLQRYAPRTLRIKNQTNGMEMNYTLVADGEADLATGKISVNSPIGKGLLGKSVGDVAEIQVPNGVMKFDIIEISR